MSFIIELSKDFIRSKFALKLVTSASDKRSKYHFSRFYYESARKVWGSIPGSVKSDVVSPSARHRCDVSSELCCPGVKPRRWMSAAWPSGSKRRFYDGHDRKVDGSTPTQASLLRSWIRCFTTIISAWWNLTSSKLKKSEAKTQAENSETRATTKRVWIRPMHSASVAFS